MCLELNQVTVRYPDNKTVLDKIDLRIGKGEFIGITGKAGCGKTTLIETIGGLHQPESGIVSFKRQNIYGDKFDQKKFRRSLQIVFQFPENQFFETSIYNEIAYGLKMLNYSESEIDFRVKNAMPLMGIPENTASLSPFALSGGQKRRLATACALALEPEILLLDEPFSGLDAEGTKSLIETLQMENRKGMTILMVSHDPNILCEICGRVILISKGIIAADDSPAKVFHKSLKNQISGIGIPDTLDVANRIGLDLGDNLTYDSFLNKLSVQTGKMTDD